MNRYGNCLMASSLTLGLLVIYAAITDNATMALRATAGCLGLFLVLVAIAWITEPRK